MKDKITKILKSNPKGLKAEDIAGKLGTSRSSINVILYRNMDVYERDSNYRWKMRVVPINKMSSPSHDTSKVREINKKLREERRKRKQEAIAVTEKPELSEDVRQLIIDAVIASLAANEIMRSKVNIEQIVEDVVNTLLQSKGTVETSTKQPVIQSKPAAARKPARKKSYDYDELKEAIHKLLANDSVGMTAYEIAIKLNTDSDDVERHLRNHERLYKPVGNYRYVIRAFYEKYESSKENKVADVKDVKPTYSTPAKQPTSQPMKKPVSISQSTYDKPTIKIKSDSIVETCHTCNKEFEITLGEINHYEQLGYKLPTHCKECRKSGIAGIELITATATVGRNSNWGHQPNKYVYGK